MSHRSLAVALTLGLVFIGACGDDDDADEDATTTTADAGDEGEGDGESAAGGEFCPAYTELLAGDPEPEQIREVAAIAPEGAAEPLEEIATGFEEDPEGYFDSTEFGELFGQVSEVANEECADDTIDVTAVDYAYEGVPTELSTGTIGVNFSNDGTEFHEFIVFRKNEGVTESFPEIFELEEEAASELVSEVGAAFAAPGESFSTILDVAEPGEYAAVCFVPLGSTPEVEEGDGPPHVSQGMLAEFTVS